MSRKVRRPFSGSRRVIFALIFGFCLLSNSSAIANDETTKFIKKFDISEFLKPKSRFLGFIDPNYQRLKIVYSKVTKDKVDPTKYLVEGFSIVKKNTCKFSGFIKFEKMDNVRQATENPDDDLFGLKSGGELIGAYELKEEPGKSCGVFKGKMVFNWTLDKHGKIHYDDTDFGVSDNSKNNQYTGTWGSHGSTKTKTANWGESRIPNSGDFDNGAGEFHPDDKYRKNGWDNYGESTDI